MAVQHPGSAPVVTSGGYIYIAAACSGCSDAVCINDA